MCLLILQEGHSLLELPTLSGQPGPNSAATSPDPLVWLLYKYLPWAKIIHKIMSQTILSAIRPQRGHRKTSAGSYVFPPIVLLHPNWREGREGTSDGDGGEKLPCLAKGNTEI